ncbi:MAG TPA: PP2C family protein-serine/threonine phosphatase [Candidatus Eisenbacteria bacterium]|nr:PP2C family protein-serine/threonine phosphatase [Candidatus Eisenbacteria bacterium]
MDRSWRAAWAAWTIVIGLAIWGLADCPRRGDVGLLLRGDKVGAVERGSPAAAAGLAPGERIRLAADPSDESLRLELARLTPGQSLSVVHGQRSATLVARAPSRGLVAYRLAWALVALGFLLLGAAVGRRRRDRVALVFFLWCTASGLVLAPRPAWPIAAGAIAEEILSSAAALFLPALLVHFFALLPESRGRRRKLVAYGLYGGAAAWTLAQGVAATAAPGLQEALLPVGALLFAAGAAGALISFALSYRGASPRHRRRLQVLFWSAAVGLVPLVAMTLWSNLGSDPGALGRLSALLVLCVPAGFAYAIEVHQVFDFRWRPSRDRAVTADALPTTPPVFAAADSRSVVDAVAADLHSRLGLAHCGVFRTEERNGAVLATWLGDLPTPPAPAGLPADVSRALTRLSRPADLGEVGALVEGTASRAALGDLREGGTKLLLPLFSGSRLVATLALGPGLSLDLSLPRHRAALREYAAHASLAVEHADLGAARDDHSRVDRELEVARGIQEHLLPERDPVFPTLAAAGASIPSGRVGGDYYDYLPLGPRRFGVAVGDVCGKGVPAALLVAHVQAALRRHAGAETRPGEVLNALNQELARYHQAEKFVCLAYAVVDAPSRTVTWANGGLHPPLWIKPGDGVHALPGGDLILGVESETRYREHQVHLAPGESVVLLTDGILDARSGNEDFGDSLLPECLGRWAHLRAPRLRDRLLAEARGFHRTGIIDDMTVVVLQAM